MQPPLPGPRILKFTNIQARLIDILLTISTGCRLLNYLHRHHGPVLQLSRNEVLINSPTAIRDLYAISNRLDRPGPLVLFHNYCTSNLVSTCSGSLHHQRRKPLRSTYSLSSFDHPITQSLIHTTTARLLTHLSTQTPNPISLRAPLRTYLYELLSPLIYGPTHALSLFTNHTLLTTLTTNDDTHQSTRLTSPLVLLPAFFPKLTLFLRRHNLVPTSISGATPSNLVADQLGRAALAALNASSPPGGADTSPHPPPLIAQLHAHYVSHGPTPACPSEEYILSDCLDHFWAGVSTTLDALVPLFAYLAKDTGRQERLRAEVRRAAAAVARHRKGGSEGIEDGTGQEGVLMQDAQLRKLKYLDAVIRETLRLNPPIPVSVARRTPTPTPTKGGKGDGDGDGERESRGQGEVRVCGRAIPPGTVIGASPLVLGRNEEVFERAGLWAPERWLVGEDGGEDGVGRGEVEEEEKRRARRKLQEMKTCSNFAFGAGPRMCLGANVAWGVMRAVVAGVVGEFEVEEVGRAEEGVRKWWWWSGEGIAGGGEKVVLRKIGERVMDQGDG